MFRKLPDPFCPSISLFLTAAGVTGVSTSASTAAAEELLKLLRVVDEAAVAAGG
jgi:hypothetical protein